MIAKIRGNPHLDERPLEGKALEVLMANVAIGDLSQLARLDGHFAILGQNEISSVAITDREGSYSIFFCKSCGKFSLRFGCECAASPRHLSRAEIIRFIYSGVLPGGGTWQKNIVSLGAAEVAWVEDGILRRCPWWHPPKIGRGRRAESFDSLFGHLADKIYRFGRGKTLLLPISGGVDSRLIATLVKESGHNEVLAFSYGTADSREMVWGRKTAEILGFRWEGIEYDESTWKGLFEEENFQKFIDNWASGVSPAHIQDYPASQRLKEILGSLENTVLLPGFGPVEPDIQISATERNGGELNREQTLAKLIRHEMFLWNIWNPRWNGWRELKRILREEWKADPEAADLAGHDYILHWYWKNRFSRYLMNSQRNYERFGGQWLLPLCDHRWVNNRLSQELEDSWQRRGIINAASKYVRRFGIDLPFAASAGRIFLPDSLEGFFERNMTWLPIHVSRKVLARSKSGSTGDWMRWSVLLPPSARKRIRFVGVPNFMSFMVLLELQQRQGSDPKTRQLLNSITEGISEMI